MTTFDERQRARSDRQPIRIGVAPGKGQQMFTQDRMIHRPVIISMTLYASICALPLLCSSCNYAGSPGARFIPVHEKIPPNGCGNNTDQEWTITISRSLKAGNDFDLDVKQTKVPAGPLPPAGTNDSGHMETPLDIDLRMDGNTRKLAKITVVLAQGLGWKFLDDGRAITSNEGSLPHSHLGFPSLNDNKEMFCNFSQQGDNASFVIKHKQNRLGNNATYGHYNINIMQGYTGTGGTLKLPVSIDPEVKNEG